MKRIMRQFLGKEFLAICSLWVGCITGVISAAPPPQPSIINMNVLNTGTTVWGDAWLSHLAQSMRSGLHDLHIGEHAANTGQWIEQHKKHLICAAGLISYALLQYHIVRLNGFLLDPARWSFWHASQSFAQLETLGAHAMGTLLLKDIQYAYMSAQNPTDFVQPLICFMHDVDAELAALNRYAFLSRWIRRLFLGGLFSLCTEIYTHIDERVKRLGYIKQTFFVWLAEYKIDTQTTSAQTVSAQQLSGTTKKLTERYPNDRKNS